MTSSTKTLIAETLHYRRLSGAGCFVTNAASEELCQHGEEVLPEIEEAIRDLKISDSGTCGDHNDLIGRYPGLLNLWMAYYHLGAARHVPRIIHFLRSLDGPVLATAILAMNPMWPDEEGMTTIPSPLLQLVRDVAEKSTGCVKEVAAYYLPGGHP